MNVYAQVQSHTQNPCDTHNPPFFMMLGMRGGGDTKSISVCNDEGKVNELQKKPMT